MREALAKWVSDADALRHLEYFKVPDTPLALGYLRPRADDYYLSLVGELFDRMKAGYGDAAQWARLGNALAHFAAREGGASLEAIGVLPNEATLFAAASFYYGGFPASAYLTMRDRSPAGDSEPYQACFDLLARPSAMKSKLARRLLAALRKGDLAAINQAAADSGDAARRALELGPDSWIAARLLEQLVGRFRATNVRAVLPDGASEFWTPLVSSLLNRRPSAWEFFPSQIEAIERGLLTRSETFSLQMPTGAGKTALCETLLYAHLKRNPDAAAVLLVPYRSLAAELRGSLVKRLNGMGLSARCAYGGTVPAGDEVRALDETRAMVATPEALSGLLSADPSFFGRISLAVIDEGHLLGGGDPNAQLNHRGVGLELLLARLRAREDGGPRIVFVSAIVPNIEEINAWLGGSADSVVRSDYRPALAEFAVLRPAGEKKARSVALDMHPHEAAPTRFAIQGFLSARDFQWKNPATGKTKTYPFTSVKTLAVATARKALPMGASAVFAANKRGNQGAVGLAEELLEQLEVPLPLPRPTAFAKQENVTAAVEYLKLEYGADWVGTRALAAGAVLHHGDVPQETREIVERLVRQGDIRLAICTNTLAEGVNLPIRTLVLYSVQRRVKDGPAENLLARDIKNLVGRAGRAGATTKGLVITANEQQWPLVERVARQAPGEPVTGALRALVDRLRAVLANQTAPLTNADLEETSELHTLVDGIDSTLIDLAAEEIGEEELVHLAVQLADQTFASSQADAVSKKLLQDVFALRAHRVAGIRSAGRLEWVRETGTRARMLDAVESGLLPRRAQWDDVTDPIDASVVSAMLDWAWTHPELRKAIHEAYRLKDDQDASSVQQPFADLVSSWLSGQRFADMASAAALSVDDLLGVHTGAIGFVLQTIVEQGIALLGKLLESQEKSLAPAVAQLPEHLRFGVPSPVGRVLASGGVRHRRAAVELGADAAMSSVSVEERGEVYSRARGLIVADRQSWEHRLGKVVYENTLWDLSSMTGEREDE